jgi:zinc ribbon family protein
MRDFIAESALYLFKYLFPCCRSCSIMPYKCGQKPGRGRYVCRKCGEDVRLNHSTDALPKCRRCANCEFVKG